MAVATSSQQHVDDTATGVTTVASLARDWARRTPHHVAMREKDFGIWQEYTWDETWKLVLDAAHGLLALGVERRRPGLDPRRGPPRVGHPRPRHRRRARHHGRALPDQPGRRGRVPARPTRGASGAPRRGPGAGRQGARRSPRGSPSLRTIVYLEPRGLQRLRRRPADVVGRLPRARPRAPRRAPRRRRRAAWPRPSRRRDDARLHVGHHRPAEGGDAHQRQRRLLPSTRSSTLPERLPGRQAARPATT